MYCMGEMIAKEIDQQKKNKNGRKSTKYTHKKITYGNKKTKDNHHHHHHYLDGKDEKKTLW